LSATDLANINNTPTTSFDTHLATANKLVGGDPVTPVFRAPAGMHVRFRLMNPGGIGDNQQVFELYGHNWQESPYTNDSTAIGKNPKSNWIGTITGYGVTSHYDAVVDSAGGINKVPGDYLFRSWTANQFQVGAWGIFRVGPGKCASPSSCPDTVSILSVSPGRGAYSIKGTVSVTPSTRRFANQVSVDVDGSTVSRPVDANGFWSHVVSTAPLHIIVRSSSGGMGEYRSDREVTQITAPQRRKLQIPQPASR